MEVTHKGDFPSHTIKIIMKSFAIILIAFIALTGCQDETNGPIAQSSDYDRFLDISLQKEIVALEEEVHFWTNKISYSAKGFTYYQKLGSCFMSLFEKTGQISYLHRADSAFIKAAASTNGAYRANNLLSLSSISIKKHDFEAAAHYAVEAKSIANEKLGSLLMQFDAEMELGNYQMARSILDRNKQKSNFDYLVRLSKFKDHEGNLDSAIVYMEQAERLVEKESSGRKIWAKANLGDMYGHAGRISDAYKKYIEVLSLDSTYAYALKGIAWITYSADNNPDEALRILERLYARTNLPDLLLDMAEVHEYKGNSELSHELTTRFINEVSNDKYLQMYSKYLIEIYLERGAIDQAQILALQEVANRPTPATYDWLALVYLHKGDIAKALEIYQEYVEGQSEEPEILLHMGIAYHEAGDSKGISLLNTCLEAAFELGPVSEKKIRKILKS